MTCRELAEFILEYLDGELPQEVRQEFETHLTVCENCREYIATYLAAVELGRRAFRDPESDAVNEGVPKELIAAILAAAKKRDPQ